MYAPLPRAVMIAPPPSGGPTDARVRTSGPPVRRRLRRFLPVLPGPVQVLLDRRLGLIQRLLSGLLTTEDVPPRVGVGADPVPPVRHQHRWAGVTQHLFAILTAWDAVSPVDVLRRL